MTAEQDAELIQQILAGDREQYALLMRKYNTMLYRIGRAYGFTDADTEDIMQETFIQAYMQLHRLRRPRAFQKWLATIMVRMCYQAQHRARLTTSWEQAPASSTFTPNMENSDLKHWLEQAILQLPQAYRIVFVMKELNGYSIRQIAHITGISVINVKVRLFRARQMLRQILTQAQVTDELLAFEAPRCEALADRVMKAIRGAYQQLHV
ncbi:RNA polymerase sigma-70 factor (ECF subfamily) [Thermoflavifilum aggregans]|uniref:RNA polymerase sigma-70 factor (ECF subfamily) n=1 Tax=Thermoflavifilum aggregans TaxID=454188 RepID=A0A2M9CRR0_9BACT|nr:sigma-70 family RNA polymerase sigma factor [Thermoflavifilum aggregans]PJJ74518.1 RNA polymerase sigma-70 factor (ECF subfamily) [Thermoflavifilum aggregans]